MVFRQTYYVNNVLFGKVRRKMKVWIAKQGFKILGKVTDKILKAREIKRLRDYVEKDNELDIKVRDLENTNVIICKQLEISNKKIDKNGKTIEELEKDVAILKKDSHPPQEFICCRRCGCKIAKTKSKKRRK